MEINSEIAYILRHHNIDVDAGTIALLGIYFGLDVDKVCNEDVVAGINITKIVEKDYKTRPATLTWNVQLFKGMETHFEWVSEWNAKWDNYPARKGSTPTVVKRMKEFFSKHPQFRKEDVLTATDLYLSEVQGQFILNSGKFIFNPDQKNESVLYAYCERVKSGNTSTRHFQRGVIK